jgi:putative CocE/NonD family hydrolase
MRARAGGRVAAFFIAVTIVSLGSSGARGDEAQAPDAAKMEFQWGVKIPMRDGVRLNATVYTPKGQEAPAPCIFTLTPYISQSYHDRGVYFAARGLPFLTVDVRGRGNSEGVFRPMIQEAQDGHDVVEWLAAQPYCNGKVATWGGSYAGYNQWALAKERPAHLATIVPVASAHAGTDFPMSGNIRYPYIIQWLTLTSGRASQQAIFGDAAFWGAINREWFESGRSLAELDGMVGNPSPIFQEWLQHPERGPYWDAYAPTAEQYAALRLPILTITGSYDGDQPGALEFYRDHMRHGSPEARTQHHLVIGPWDHPGTRTPQAEFGGLKFAPASLVDLPQLHVDWYAWTMQGGPKPRFLADRVAYYVMGAESWRYAPTLEAVTASARPLYLDSRQNATDVFVAGSLDASRPGRGAPDRYVYDPRDTSSARIESTPAVGEYTDQRLILANSGKQLVYHSEPFAEATEVSGFFTLSAWIAIDRPDTDFIVSVYEIAPDGSSILLTGTELRARYRESLREAKLIATREPLRYDFNGFTFTSRMLRKGSRLRLVVGPVNSMYSQKNYNSGGDVSSETLRDARTVTVKLYHDRAHPTALYVPIGRP